MHHQMPGLNRVGGQEEELGFGGADGGANGAALMAAEVIHDDNVAWRKDRDENLLDISAEACAVDRSVDHAGRGQPVATQRRQKRRRPPSAEGRLGDEALALKTSAKFFQSLDHALILRRLARTHAHGGN